LNQSHANVGHDDLTVDKPRSSCLNLSRTFYATHEESQPDNSCSVSRRGSPAVGVEPDENLDPAEQSINSKSVITYFWCRVCGV